MFLEAALEEEELPHSEANIHQVISRCTDEDPTHQRYINLYSSLSPRVAHYAKLPPSNYLYRIIDGASVVYLKVQFSYCCVTLLLSDVRM